MTKGADSIMFPLINMGIEDSIIVKEHLYKFACSGLRTLVMA
jgi:hypothetical protein